MNKKTLLIFAHTLEAQAFILEMNLSHFPFLGGKTYANENYFLLISGEGCQVTTEVLSYFLALHHQQIGQILNFGVAGSFSEDYKTGEIHSIRSVYREQDNQMLFKSFESCDSLATVDIVTTHTRIHLRKNTLNIEDFAPLIDRELWAIASVCKLFKLSFSSYKIISDFIEEEPKMINFCNQIKEDANIFSLKLFLFFQEKLSKNSNQKILKNEMDISPTLTSKDLYFTVSGQRNYKNLISSLKIKLKISEEEILKMIPMNQSLNNEKNLKKKTQLFMQELSYLLNPFQKKIKDKLKDLTLPLERKGCHIKFSKDFESDQLELSANIKNQYDLDRLKKALSILPYKEIQQTLHGKVDV